MKKELFEKIINECLKTGADFSDVYYEDINNRKYYYTDGKLDNVVNVNHRRGIGIRIIDNDNTLYVSSNNLNEDNLLDLSKRLASNFDKKQSKAIQLSDLVEKYHKNNQDFREVSIDEKKNLFKRIETIAKSYSNLISRVEVMLIENSGKKIVANSLGKFIKFNQSYCRLIVICYATRDDRIEEAYFNIGKFGGIELLNYDKYEEKIKECCDDAISKIDAISVKGGYYPVVLGPGFGGVIFHEACGHGLEATCVSDKKSVFCNKLGTKVASDVVTLIDDGTIEEAWGSILVDDEGNLPQKNILIENGILKSYLVDYKNKKRMNHEITGSARRESYMYQPTSRMTNTYLLGGNTTLDEMIQSIDYGFYCKTMDGGSVECETGNFNFAVGDAFLIEKGKITKKVKGCSLIGTSVEILKNVEMVGNDLELGTGYCGSKSGIVPVTVGEPHIKVSKILVGGK